MGGPDCGVERRWRAILQVRGEHLTRMTLGVRRDGAGRFLAGFPEAGEFAVNPFASIDVEGVGERIQIAAVRRRAMQPDLKSREGVGNTGVIWRLLRTAASGPSMVCATRRAVSRSRPWSPQTQRSSSVPDAPTSESVSEYSYITD